MLATTPTPRSMEERSFNLTFDDHTSHADSHSTGTSHTSSPESRPVDLQSPIPEEEEDETSSEAANEPLTPTDTLHHPTTFQDKMNGNQDVAHTLEAIRAPLIVNTAATPPSSSSGKEDVTPASQKTIPKTPVSKRDGRFKRTMSGLFGKSNPQTGALLTQPFTQTDQSAIGSDPMLGKENRRMSLTARRMSATNSPYTTRSNSPPSLASPTEEKEQLHLQVQEPSRDEFLHHNKKNRSSTGLSFRRFSKLKEKPAFPTSSNVPNDAMHRHRATSVDLDGACEQKDGNEVPMRRQPWGMAAETGSGLKARRMSLSLPDDFTVDVVELYSEYADQSKMIGRRGKTLGNGATANVALMRKKGAPSTDLYAVKEFRGKSSTENSEDYEKKVKSEYSIAKSVHHPNIVETFRLCTHNGRWNHVMEFCDQGDLFGLVNHPTHYLTKQDHLPDRLCLFKQLLQGLNYLHSNGIAHRDIKLENLLITKDSKLKITDFGVSEVFAGIHPGLRSAGGQCGQCMEDVRLCAPGICGSMPYVAPEVIAKQGAYDPKPLDVWSAAIVVLCMCAGSYLWEEATPGKNSTYDALVKGWDKWYAKNGLDTVPDDSNYPYVNFFDAHINPPSLRKMLLRMLNPDPSKRLTIAEAVKKPWMKNTECCQVDSYDDPTVIIDATKRSCAKKTLKVVHHNHLPPSKHHGHNLVRLPGPTDM